MDSFLVNTNIIYFYCYFLFFYSSWSICTYYIYKVLDREIIIQTQKMKELLMNINDVFDIFEDGKIEEMNIDTMLNDVEKIKTNL